MSGPTLRSREWLDSPELYGWLRRAALRSQGFGEHALDGSPVIGVCSSWSELTHCNAHLRAIGEAVKRGVSQAGGIPLEFPVMSLGEYNMRPTTMLYRNLVSMDVEESVRANPLDGVVLLAGCDKTTPAMLMGAISADVPAIMVTGGPQLKASWRGEELGTCTDCRRYQQELRAGRITDDDWADPWVGYWQDLLGENAKVYGGVPHSTGPFKEWIHRSLVEDRGYDRFATELLLMEGTAEQQGTIGFQQSFGSDVPMAEKAHVISQAFMGATMKCARCHDSPLNRYRQRDLFGIAAMLQGEPVAIPETSSVGEVPGRRKPAVPITNKPGDRIPPSFVFDRGRDPARVGPDARAHREALAAWMVSQRRFAQVGVNRVWQRFMGRGLVHPIDDWDPEPQVSHPRLLDFLTEEFIANGYSVRHVQELILKSHAYQRRRDQELAGLRDTSGRHLFAAQGVRRMRAEEIVDSLHLTVRRPFKSERIAYQKVDYGIPERTWQIVSLSNEEDVAVLAKPLLQEIITLAKAFGWRDQRPNPLSVRNDDPHALQPLALANGDLMHRLVKFTDRSYYTELSREAGTLDQYGDRLFLNTLSRLPTEREARWLRNELGALWSRRLVPPELREARKEEAGVEAVTVTDSIAAHQYIMRVRQGEPAATALTPAWRRNAEKVLWAVLNSPEFMFLP